MTYTPLHEQLLPFLATAWENIPPDLQATISKADHFRLWDDLTPHQRSQMLGAYDYENNPAIDPAARQRDEALVQKIIENDEETAKWERATNTQNDPLRIKTRDDKLNRLDLQYRKLDAELMTPYQTRFRTPPLPGTRTGRGRQLGTKTAITLLAEQVAGELSKEFGSLPTSKLVMSRLQDMVDADINGAEILIKRCSNSVVWRTSKGVDKKYDLDACGNTILRLRKSRGF